MQASVPIEMPVVYPQRNIIWQTQNHGVYGAIHHISADAKFCNFNVQILQIFWADKCLQMYNLWTSAFQSGTMYGMVWSSDVLQDIYSAKNRKEVK